MAVLGEEELGRAEGPDEGPGSGDHGAGPVLAGVSLAPAPVPTTRRTNLLVELSWLVFLVWIYTWLQDLAPLRRHLAGLDATRVLSLEVKIGLHPERALDHWLAHHSVLAFLASNFYDNAIFAVTFGFAVVVWWRRPDLYRSLRNDLVLANLIAFAVFWAFPVAPPRMLAGYIDVVQRAGGLGAWHDTLIKHADQLAAMPSMHLGYAVWCSVAAWRLARAHRARVVAVVFGVTYPLFTAVVVMATGNHYLLDVLAGTATTFVAIAAVEVVTPATVQHLKAGWLQLRRA